MTGRGMILAVDVSYREDRAVVAGVLFESWDDCEPSRIVTTELSQVAAYVPGQFYKRELPCILGLLERLEALPDVILVDGYVYLGRARRPGLGKRLYDALGGRAAVIGVAKSRFKGTPASTEVFRAGSRRPLYVTAVGIGQAEAKRRVQGMCGEYRMPEMVRLADRLSKELE